MIFLLDVKKVVTSAILPTRAGTSAGLDLYALDNVFIPLGDTVKLRTGIAVDIPTSYFGKIEDRSSIASKGLRTGGGVIDAGYHGEILVVIHNISGDQHPVGFRGRGYYIEAGNRIAQLILHKISTPVVNEVTAFPESERGENGFGSTGA